MQQFLVLGLERARHTGANAFGNVGLVESWRSECQAVGAVARRRGPQHGQPSLQVGRVVSAKRKARLEHAFVRRAVVFKHAFHRFCDFLLFDGVIGLQAISELF